MQHIMITYRISSSADIKLNVIGFVSGIRLYSSPSESAKSAHIRGNDDEFAAYK